MYLTKIVKRFYAKTLTSFVYEEENVDMTLFEKIKFLADKQGKSINDVENDLEYAKNTLYRLKKNKPGSEKLEELANYFHVSTDYLLGRTDEPQLLLESNKDKQALQVGGLFRSVSNEEKLSETEQEELKEDISWYLRERARLIKEKNSKGN